MESHIHFSDWFVLNGLLSFMSNFNELERLVHYSELLCLGGFCKRIDYIDNQINEQDSSICIPVAFKVFFVVDYLVNQYV